MEPGRRVTIIEAEEGGIRRYHKNQEVGRRVSKAVGRAEARRWGMVPVLRVPGIEQQRHAAAQLGPHAKPEGIIV